MQQQYQTFVVVGPSGQPYPCTIANGLERTQELAALAFCAPWPQLWADGFRVHSATLIVGAVVDPIDPISPRTALAWSQQPLTGDRYHDSMVAAGVQLVGAGRGAWVQSTQWASGATLWRNRDSDETILIDGPGVQS